MKAKTPNDVAFATPDPEPITARELKQLHKRAVHQSKKGKNGLLQTMLLRLAIDADHIAKLIDEEDGIKTFSMWVQVKPKRTIQVAPKKKSIVRLKEKE